MALQYGTNSICMYIQTHNILNNNKKKTEEIRHRTNHADDPW